MTRSYLEKNRELLKIQMAEKREKALKAAEECIAVMDNLTIDESKLARKYLSRIMDDMYKRSSDTLIGTIQPDLESRFHE